VAVEIIGEKDRALVAEFAVAVPVAPPPLAVIEVDSADALDLFAAGGDRVLDHQVLRARALGPQPRHDQVAGTQLAGQRFDLPARLAALFTDTQPQVFPTQLQIIRRLRGEAFFFGVVLERRRGVEHADAALEDFHLIAAHDLAAFAFDDHRLPGGG